MYVNGKIRPVEAIPEMGEGEIKENDGWGWIQLWYIVRTFVNVPPKSNNIIIFKKRKKLKARE
jgi:hypothetical protein